MDIALSSDALDVALHPREDAHILSAGLISGKVQLFDYARGIDEQGESLGGKEKGYRRLWSIRPTHKSCRGVTFDSSGDNLYCISKDRSLLAMDPATGQAKRQWKDAHDSAPSRLLSISEELLATGDDDGVVRLWDPRKSGGAVHSYDHHYDWITDMLWCPHLDAPRVSREEVQKRKRKEMATVPESRERLVCTSGDATMSVIDVRAGKKGVEVSEDQEDELLSVAALQNGKKLVVGTQLGVLSLWAPSRGLLDHVDRFVGHPASVDTMCALDDDTVLTGSSDGLIRVVQLFPHKLLGIVGDHDEMPVERVRRKGHWVASIGHGSEVKLTNLGPLLGDGDADSEEDEPPMHTPAADMLHVARSTEASDESESEEEREAPERKSSRPDGRDVGDFFADL